MVKHHSEKFLKLVQDAKTRIKEISAEQVKKKLSNKEKFHLIDVREASEWESGHAQGAMHLSRGVLERDIEKTIPDVNAEIVLYCGGGFRSALAADNLEKMGYRKVYSMQGGWGEWVELGGAIEKD